MVTTALPVPAGLTFKRSHDREVWSVLFTTSDVENVTGRSGSPGVTNRWGGRGERFSPGDQSMGQHLLELLSVVCGTHMEPQAQAVSDGGNLRWR